MAIYFKQNSRALLDYAIKLLEKFSAKLNPKSYKHLSLLKFSVEQRYSIGNLPD